MALILALIYELIIRNKITSNMPFNGMLWGLLAGFTTNIIIAAFLYIDIGLIFRKNPSYKVTLSNGQTAGAAKTKSDFRVGLIIGALLAIPIAIIARLAAE